ncbi:MAG: WD40 repeat domain-containing protein, partial [Candidatus Omnitrophota bacterium]
HLVVTSRTDSDWDWSEAEKSRYVSFGFDGPGLQYILLEFALRRHLEERGVPKELSDLFIKEILSYYPAWLQDLRDKRSERTVSMTVKYLSRRIKEYPAGQLNTDAICDMFAEALNEVLFKGFHSENRLKLTKKYLRKVENLKHAFPWSEEGKKKEEQPEWVDRFTREGAQIQLEDARTKYAGARTEGEKIEQLNRMRTIFREHPEATEKEYADLASMGSFEIGRAYHPVQIFDLKVGLNENISALDAPADGKKVIVELWRPEPKGGKVFVLYLYDEGKGEYAAIEEPIAVEAGAKAKKVKLLGNGSSILVLDSANTISQYVFDDTKRKYIKKGAAIEHLRDIKSFELLPDRKHVLVSDVEGYLFVYGYDDAQKKYILRQGFDDFVALSQNKGKSVVNSIEVFRGRFIVRCSKLLVSYFYDEDENAYVPDFKTPMPYLITAYKYKEFYSPDKSLKIEVTNVDTGKYGPRGWMGEEVRTTPYRYNPLKGKYEKKEDLECGLDLNDIPVIEFSPDNKKIFIGSYPDQINFSDQQRKPAMLFAYDEERDEYRKKQVFDEFHWAESAHFSSDGKRLAALSVYGGLTVYRHDDKENKYKLSRGQGYKLSHSGADRVRFFMNDEIMFVSSAGGVKIFRNVPFIVEDEDQVRDIIYGDRIPRKGLPKEVEKIHVLAWPQRLAQAKVRFSAAGSEDERKNEVRKIKEIFQKHDEEMESKESDHALMEPSQIGKAFSWSEGFTDRTGKAHKVVSTDFSPDGRRVIAVIEDPATKIRRLVFHVYDEKRRGFILQEQASDDKAVVWTKISRDGKRVLVREKNIHTNKESLSLFVYEDKRGLYVSKGRLLGENYDIDLIRFSEDCDKIFMSAMDALGNTKVLLFYVYDKEKGKYLMKRHAAAHGSKVTAAEFYENGKELVLGVYGPKEGASGVFFYHYEAGAKDFSQTRPPLNHRGRVSAVALLQDKETLAVGDEEGNITIYAKDKLKGTYKIKQVLGFENKIGKGSVSSIQVFQGHLLVKGNVPGSFPYQPERMAIDYIYDEQSGKYVKGDLYPIGAKRAGSKSFAQEEYFSPDKKYKVVVTNLIGEKRHMYNINADLHVLDEASGKYIHQHPLLTFPPQHRVVVEFSPDGKKIFIGSRSGRGAALTTAEQSSAIFILDEKERTYKLKKSLGDLVGVHSAHFSQDGKKLIVGSREGKTRLYKWNEIEENYVLWKTWKYDFGKAFDLVRFLGGDNVIFMRNSDGKADLVFDHPFIVGDEGEA